MVTNYPHAFASQERPRTAADGARADNFSGRLMDLLRQTFCAMHGHDTLLHFERERMALRCVSCGHETPGWELNTTPPTVTIRGDLRRHAPARPQPIAARRIA